MEPGQVLRVACIHCVGMPPAAALSCPHCKGRRTVQREVPRASARERLVLRTYYAMVGDAHALPVPGGWLQQAAGWATAADLLFACSQASTTRKQEVAETLGKLKRG